MCSRKASTPGEIDLRKMREARRNGWFSFEMAVDPARPTELVCTYWGGQANRSFDVLVDNVKIATQTLNQDKPGEPFDVTYALPVELTAGKQKITVKLQAGTQPGRGVGAGPLLRAMTLRK
jgi:hypothetical protein